jgi:methylated-DNA-[protein]-cysteine S-methyltransferase
MPLTTTSDLVFTRLGSPIGSLLLVAGPGGLRHIVYGSGPKAGEVEQGWREDGSRFDEPARQLAEYFAGRRRRFDLKLAPEGTAFQRRVWRELTAIPYGETISYSELARRIGNARALRAVGLANGSNPLPIVIPCHRVIGSNGSLTGYGGGLAIKRALLDLERGQTLLPSTRGAGDGP